VSFYDSIVFQLTIYMVIPPLLLLSYIIADTNKEPTLFGKILGFPGLIMLKLVDLVPSIYKEDGDG